MPGWGWNKSGRQVASAAMAVGLAFGGASSASAYYIGPSYLKIAGIAGGAKEPAHVGWIRAESNYWTEHPELREIRGITGKYNGLKFTGPRTPASGPSMLAVSIAKTSPALAGMMERCRAGTPLGEVIYSESADMARHPQEHGPRPRDIPAFYEYKLRNVRLTCPVVEGAPEQAFGLHFDAIEWMNFKPLDKPREIMADPVKLGPAPRTGTSKAWVISWFAPVADSSENQCPKMNPKPSQADYFALMSPERASAQRAALADKGGANSSVMPYRGPDEMNVTMMPGIVVPPPFYEPQVDVVRGFNLDGDDGSGPVPASTRPHKNYTSPEGLKGVDNQLFTVQGCIEGWRRKGFLPMIGNELRRAGGLSMLVEVSGIDDEKNDNDVAVTILYSADPMRRAGTSKAVLPDYTFRVNDTPEFTSTFARFKGRIVNGVVETEPLEMATVQEGSANSWRIAKARMRLEMLTDGTLKALLGGYRDWRQYVAAAFFRSSDYENTIGFQTPGLYNAVRQAADGLRDPVTGEFTGISAAYELEGLPAFLPPEQQKLLLAGKPLRQTGAKLSDARD